jgi:proline iminopeptidase
MPAPRWLRLAAAGPVGYRGVGRFFPEVQHRFRAGVLEVDRDGDLIAAYARLMEHPGPGVRATAATEWCAWGTR